MTSLICIESLSIEMWLTLCASVASGICQLQTCLFELF